VDTAIETGEGRISRKMYLEKRDLNIYLPLTLYFDNDRPNPKYYSPKTNKTYTDTYFPFIDKKEYYKRRSAGTSQGEDRIIHVQKMDDFFEFDIKGGYEKMKLFLSALLGELHKGHSFEIKIKGYASPLSTSSYNRILGQRRVNSVRNEISKYVGGKILPFIDSGQLLITDISYGEDLSPSYVSDLSSDLRASVFSVEASMERRTEIIEIKNSEDR